MGGGRDINRCDKFKYLTNNVIVILKEAETRPLLRLSGTAKDSKILSEMLL
jgi:hypothetical protein